MARPSAFNVGIKIVLPIATSRLLVVLVFSHHYKICKYKAKTWIPSWTFPPSYLELAIRSSSWFRDKADDAHRVCGASWGEIARSSITGRINIVNIRAGTVDRTARPHLTPLT